MALLLHASPLALRSGGGSDGSAPRCGMRGCPSLWPLPRSCTIPHEDRGWPGPGIPSRCSSVFTKKSPAGGRLPAWQSRRGHRSGSRGTPWSTSLTSCVLLPWCRSSMLLCRRRWNSWWTSSVSSIRCVLFPNRLSKCRRSCFCRDTQLVEQLVEVPTLVSYSALQRTVEQHVDIPVPVGRGRNAGLQGFFPEQSSTFSISSSERISEQIMEQIVDIPVARGDPQGFRTRQSSSSVAHSSAAWLNTEDGTFQGGFSHYFPGRKYVPLPLPGWME